MEYIFTTLSFAEHGGPMPSVSVGTQGISTLRHQSYPAAFPLYVVGRLKPGNNGTVTVSLSPEAEMGGTESAETREYPPLVGPDFAPLPPPTFAVGLNPFVAAPGLHRVLVTLGDHQIADLPLNLQAIQTT